MLNRLYPYLLQPQLHEALWGGSTLVTRYGKSGDTQRSWGESWECWSESLITNGDLAGTTLGESLRLGGPSVLGIGITASAANQLPLLTKVIDAHDRLSVQVHPDDAAARRLERQENGKTECWVILQAAPNAEVMLGFARATSEVEVRQRIAAGSIADLLRRVPVRAGDVLLVPAGTIHAIGAGIVLFEVQQASTLTYRVYDWGRRDAAGQPRTLHLDKAAAVLDYRRAVHGTIKRLPYHVLGTDRQLLIAHSAFGLEEIRVPSTARFLSESCSSVVMTQREPVTVRAGNVTVDVPPWTSLFCPAGLPQIDIRATKPTSIFVATPPGADSRMRARLELAGVAPAMRDAFFAQFSDHEVATSKHG